jgi:hypothetical protein
MFDALKSGLAGGAAGAAGGALGGSFVPGLGTALGAGVGGLAGLLRGLYSGTAHQSIGGGIEGGLGQVGNTISGTPASIEQYSNLNPQQQEAQMMALYQALQGLGLNPSDFGAIENKARQDFSRYTIPSIASRLSGGRDSGAYNELMKQGGVDLETNLAALRSSHGMQQQQLLQNLLGIGLNPSIETVRNAPQQGLAQAGLTGVAQNLPMFALMKYLQNQKNNPSLGIQGQSQLPGLPGQQ